MASLIDELRAFPLFSELYDKEIKKIIKTCQFSEYAEGTSLKHENIGEAIFFILKGQAELTIEEYDKKLLIRSFSDYGVSFEFCFNNKFSERIQMKFLKNTQTMILPMKQFISMYKKNSKIYGIFTTNLFHQLFDDFSSANSLIARLFFTGKLEVGLPIYKSAHRKIWNEEERSKNRLK